MLKKDDASFEKEGRFRSGKHKQRCFNMVVAGGTQRTVKEGNNGKKKTAHHTVRTLQMVAWSDKGGFWSLDAEEILQTLCVFFFIFTLFNILLESHTPTLSSFCSKAGPLFHCRMFPHCFRDLK